MRRKVREAIGEDVSEDSEAMSSKVAQSSRRGLTQALVYAEQGGGKNRHRPWPRTEKVTARTLEELLQGLAPAQRAAVERRADELIAEELFERSAQEQ
jgi:hypothetical protein